MVYLEEGAPRFVNVTNNLDLTIELVVNGQPITDSKNEKVEKQNKHAASQKMRLDNLHTPVRAPAAGSPAFLLCCFALVFYSGSSAPFSSCPRFPTYFLPLFVCPRTSTSLLSCPISALVLKSLAILLFFSVLGATPLYLASTAAVIFKQALFKKALAPPFN